MEGLQSSNKEGRERVVTQNFISDLNFFSNYFFSKNKHFQNSGFYYSFTKLMATLNHQVHEKLRDAELRRVVDRSSKFFSIFEISADSRPLTRIPLPSNMGEKEKKRIAVIGDSFVDIVCAGMTEMPTWDGDTLCESIK